MKYPLEGNTVPFWAVPTIAIVFTFVVFLVYYFTRKDVYDFHHAILDLLFAVLLTAVITDAIKDAVGRPRPDFPPFTTALGRRPGHGSRSLKPHPR